MKEKKFFVRFKTDDEPVIRQSIANAGADIDFISEVHPNVAVITVSGNNETAILGSLRNDSLVESIFEEIQYQTF